MGILVVGSVAIDNVITPFGKNFNAPGGSATYFSLSASYFTKVKLVAVVGKDFPVKHINLLNRKGVDTKGLEVKKGKTFRWKGKYGWDLDSPQTLATHLNLFKDFKPDLPQGHRNEKMLFLANIDPELQMQVIEQTRPKLIAADTMNFWIASKKKKLLEVLKKIDILVINEHEARQLTTEGNLLKAGKEIISYGPRRVIIKKGENGVLAVSKKSFFTHPAYLLETVHDPTGAGDTFAGGFLGYLAKIGRFDDAAVKKALAYGTIMASFTVQDFDIKGLAGLSKGLIERRLRSFKRIASF